MKTFLQTLFFLLLVTQICFAQWYQQTSGTTRDLNGLAFYDLNNGIAVGDSGIILSTTNGGTTWTLQSSVTNTNLYAVSYISANWVAVGSDGTIIHNGSLQASGTTNTLHDVCFTDATNGCVVGSGSLSDGIILRTTDGGTFWSVQISGLIECLYGISFADVNNGIAVGGEYGMYTMGRILRTTDGGLTWRIDTMNVSLLTAVSFGDNTNGFTISNFTGNSHLGSPSSIIRTIDAGITWTVQLDLGWGPYLRDVSFTDANNGTVVGRYLDSLLNPILRTTDGGGTWTGQASGTTYSLNSVCFIDELTGWIVGDNGIILHTTNGGVSFVEEEQIDGLPTEFLLSQNFPNPFNPSTKIKYSVPQSSNVILKVFDILGNEIETLVNEEKPTGTYELTWNASNLPSGVYFYQLRTGSFVETKKMLLLK